jgi:adenine-specific DNA-methyltransferase
LFFIAASLCYINPEYRDSLVRHTIDISALDNNLPLPIHTGTVLKDDKGKRRQGQLPVLAYLFSFLDSYDFTSEGKAEIQEENKTLINASVLGLIFEKINGYKDGSFFTPGFITMYMCREILRRAAIQKFNEANNWQCNTFEDLQESIDYTDKEKRQQANNLINSLTVCDIAVGSGHFLVSALNELISIKQDLKILQYRHNAQWVRDYSIEIVNDELILLDIETEQLFEYKLNQQGNIKPELQAMQETLFHEKETLIENCLFGVDINANSVKICRLRLWIELLKNAYYTKESHYAELETLPNIDINIKQGNSLISRFALDADLSQTLTKSKWTIDSYKAAVNTYRNAQSKEEKRQMEELIDTIKKDFKTDVVTYDPINKKLSKLRGELALLQRTDLFSADVKKKIKANKELENLNNEIEKLDKEKEATQSNAIYKEAFEWRFEFPEVLDSEGKFIGFDVVIGNPPYVPSKNLTDSEKDFYTLHFKTVEYQINTFGLFCEQGINLIKPDSLLCFIIPNYWLATKYDLSLRRFLFIENHTTDLINVYSVFESAVVETLLLFTTKRQIINNLINVKAIDRNIKQIENRLSAVNSQNWKYSTSVLPIALDEDLSLSFEKGIDLNTTNKLGDFFNLRFGVKLYQIGKGKPLQIKDDSVQKKFESKEKIDDTYFLLLRARNVQKYFIRPENYYVKYGVHLAEPRSLSLFEGPRILVQRIVSKNVLDATYIEETFICNTDVVTLQPKNNEINIKFYNAILCSKLCSFIVRSQNVNLDRTAFPKINTATLESFPVPVYSIKYVKIVLLVEEILSNKQTNPTADTTALEAEIDALIYQLYGLTEEEIKMVEGS